MGNIVRKYEPSSSVLGDEVLSVNGRIDIEDGASIVVKEGGTLTVDESGVLDFDTAALLTIKSYALEDGDTLTVEAGATLDIEGDLTIPGAAAVESGGELAIEDGGKAAVELGGELDIEEGGALKYHGRTMQPTLMKFSYSFAADGGEIGTINLGGDIPSGAVITGGMLVVTDAITSDGAATIALHAKTADDILAAAVLGTNGTAGLHDVVADFTAAHAILLDAEKDVVLTIGEAALTAGAFDLYLEVLL